MFPLYSFCSLPLPTVSALQQNRTEQSTVEAYLLINTYDWQQVQYSIEHVKGLLFGTLC